MLLTTRLSCQTSGYVIENAIKTRWDVFAVAVQLATAKLIGLKPASVISLPVTCNTESFTYFIKHCS